MLIASLIMLANAATFLSLVLDAYPPSHIASFGPHVPGFSSHIARQAASYPICLAIAAALTIAVSIYCWFSAHPPVTKTYIVVFLAAANALLAAQLTMTVLIAYFLLPKLANAA